MLILSRKCGQRIYIGDNVTVEVLEIRHDRVRLAIDAPQEISVHREEVWLDIQAGVPPPRQNPRRR